jgi:hypothetical protein
MSQINKPTLHNCIYLSVLLGRSRATETKFLHTEDNRKDYIQVRTEQQQRKGKGCVHLFSPRIVNLE